MTTEREDLIWQAAWQWVQREFDRETFDEASRHEMLAWLAQDPSHRKAYDKAAYLWSMSGLVLPAHDLGSSRPGAPPDSDD